MNASELHFAEMHAELFESFGLAGVVVRGMDLPVAVTVVIDRAVAQYDDTGRVVRRVDLASFLVAEWQPLQGDVLTVGTWSKRVDTLDSDDGFVCKAVMYG